MSWQLVLLNAILRASAKPLLRRTRSPEQAERDFALAARLFFRRSDTTAVMGKIPGPARPIDVARFAWTEPRADGAVLHLHGGGYIVGSAKAYEGMLGRLSTLAGIPVVAPDYRLVAEAPFPAAFEDVVAVWDALVAEGCPPGRIVLGGDSAGGGLALALLSELCRRGTPPAGIYAFSPWTDLTGSGDSIDANAARDVILPASRLGDLVEMVLAGADPRDPRASPLFADFPDPPPVYLQASRCEILLDDTLRIAERLRSAGGGVEVDLWDDTPHVWQIFDGRVPEARDALVRTAAFVARRLKAPPLPDES